jgi:hypothetical protein
MTRANLLRLRLTIGEALHQQSGALRESTMAKIKGADELLRNSMSILGRRVRMSKRLYGGSVPFG